MTTTIKTCFKCNTEKPLDDFYKHSRMADGHLNKCKDCTKNDSFKGQRGDYDSYEYARGMETGFDNAKWRAAHAIRARGEKGQS